MKSILAVPIIIGACILTGCKSPSEVRQSGPEEIFHSNKNVNDVSECILSGWQEKSFLTGPVPVYIQPYKNGKTVYIDVYTWVADVIPDQDGKSKVIYFSQNARRSAEMKSVIKSCI